MKFLDKDNFKIKYMKIWNTQGFLWICMLAVLCIMIAALICLCLIYETGVEKKLFMLLLIEICVGALFIYALRAGIDEMKKHNHLVNEGVIVKGVIKNVKPDMEGFVVEAVYTDEQTGNEYQYRQFKRSASNVNRIKQMALQDSQIYLLVEKDFKNGILLLDEYCERQPWSEASTNYPKNAEIVGTMEEENSIQKVKGKIIKETLQACGSKEALMIVEADVTYFDDTEKQVRVFKGRGYTSWNKYVRATLVKEDIWVDVAFDTSNQDNYVVYLEEALDKL